MSGNAGDQKATTGEPQREHYPPPPPGQPPSHQPAFQHPNETPIPDYNIPAYDPSHPHFAPPPDDSSLYDEPPSAAGQQGGQNAGGAKASWSDRLTAFGQQAAAPFNALANKMGSEAFLPTTMDKECEKAARILRSFCKDGIYSDSAPGTVPANRPTQPPSGHASGATQNRGASTGSKPKDRVLLTIPSKVISKAVGLAIFTTARAGFHVSGATGSGVLIARLPDGSWSPPSGIQVHSVGAGFVIGIDIYDCVVVINTREALHAFTQTRMSLGSDLAVTAGPWGAGGSVDFAPGPAGKGKARESPKDGPAPAAVARPPHSQPQAQHPPNLVPPQSSQGQPGVNTGPGTAPAGTTSTSRPGSSSRERKPSPFREAIKNTKPVYSYVKSRGFYAGVQVDGTVVTERKDANADFYGARVSVGQILRGEVPPQGPAGQWPAAARGLVEVLRGAEGWHGQQQQRGQAAGVAGVASGIGRMDLGTGGAGQQSGPYSSKAEEAAAEARPAAASEPEGGAPPSYAEPTGEAGGDDLPPAYVDDGRARPGDAKSSYQ